MRKKIVALFLAVALLVGVGGVPGVLDLACSPLALMTDHELPSLVPEAYALSGSFHYEALRGKFWFEWQFCE